MFDHVYAKISPEPNTGCWIWDGSTADTGYGNIAIRVDGKQVTKLAHRLLYEIEKGPIDKQLEIDHLCRNRWCVNPDHLEPVSRRENVIRGIGPQLAAERNLAKTHCPQGHAFSGDNLYVYKGRKGQECRGCRECRRLNSFRYDQKRERR